MKLPFTSSSVLVLLLSLLQPDVVRGGAFQRVATFKVCTKFEKNCNNDTETVAEIVDSTPDGMTLVYTDSQAEEIGFVNITDYTKPISSGRVKADGEPTSVAVTYDGKYAVAAVNTSPNFVNTTGSLLIIEIGTAKVVARIALPGQPDSIKIAPPPFDKRRIVVVIENERDEDCGDGAPPQKPPGSIVLVDTTNYTSPVSWKIHKVVNMTNLYKGMEYPTDPEPEFVDINKMGMAIVTLQENNGLALLNITDGSIIRAGSAGLVDLTMIDAKEDKVINQVEDLFDIPREPDAVVWLGDSEYFASADEGDLDGGGRGFTIYDSTDLSVAYTSGNELEFTVARSGHYNEDRSGNKGNEPEGLAYGKFGGIDLLFVLSERSNVVFVYDVSDPFTPMLAQVLPTGVGPEGAKTIPSRNLLVVAAEVDDREAKIRSGISIYKYSDDSEPNYPTIFSVDREDGSPIPFAALSGLACGDAPTVGKLLSEENVVYTMEDSFFQQSRFFKIETSSFPYTLIEEYRITDPKGLLKDVDSKATFTLRNNDTTVNLDLEGIAKSAKGGFWLASEGGTIAESPNLLLKVDDTGVLTKVVTLPAAVAAKQVRFGFEGVAEDGDWVVTAIQRAWTNETNPRLGLYNTKTEAWKFVFYPLDAVQSVYGGWVGLSDIAPTGDGNFLVVERDNQAGLDAKIKKIYEISLGNFSVAEGTTIQKKLVYDLMPLLSSLKGDIYEKIEGLCATADGKLWINNDNDGLNDNSGESMLLSIKDAKYTKPEEISKCRRRRLV